MKEFKKILLPTDFTEVGAVIAAYTRYLSKKFDAEIHLLHVVVKLEHLGNLYVPEETIKKIEEQTLSGVERKMRDFAGEFLKELPVTPHIIVGDPGIEIVKFAERQSIDLIIMGTHGRKGIDMIMFGSVALRVVKKATCPVLTVNPYRLKELPL
jgi:nucleotide-binding universal stress UspA family protein